MLFPLPRIPFPQIFPWLPPLYNLSLCSGITSSWQSSLTTLIKPFPDHSTNLNSPPSTLFFFFSLALSEVWHYIVCVCVHILFLSVTFQDKQNLLFLFTSVSLCSGKRLVHTSNSKKYYLLFNGTRNSRTISEN